MLIKSEQFNVQLSKIPLVNLRLQFNKHYQLLKSEDFKVQCKNYANGSGIKTPYLSWYRFPEELFTYFVQQAIIGLEAYVPGAVYFELGARDLLNEKTLPAIRNPSSLGRSTANCYYNLLPALLSEQLQLRQCDQAIWINIKAFYKEIRNPLFHGFQFYNSNVEKTFEFFVL